MLVQAFSVCWGDYQNTLVDAVSHGNFMGVWAFGSMGLLEVWAFGSNVANGLIEPFVWHLERSVSRGRNVCRSPVRNVWIFDLEGALLRCRKPTGSDVKTHWFGQDSPLLPSPFSTYKVTKNF